MARVPSPGNPDAPSSEREEAVRNLVDRIVHGDRIAAGRLITHLENGTAGVESALRLIMPYTGRAHVVGITGPAGSGKSTLVGRLASEFRLRGSKVGVIAVDPTSPFTGGAVLGDRVRMTNLTVDKDTFVRSMASRGALGGLAPAAADAVKVLDAFGCAVVLVETVGAGQDEVDIARLSHTTVVVQVPGMGDEVQAIKAGLLEIGDLFAVNKADRVRSDIAVSDLKMMLESGNSSSGWRPPIVKTVATRGQGIAELADGIERHLVFLRDSGTLRDRIREATTRGLLEAVRQRFVEELLAGDRRGFEEMVEQISDRHLDSRSAARQLVRRFRRELPETGDISEDGK